jgi:cephalosporin hydroxylase
MQLEHLTTKTNRRETFKTLIRHFGLKTGVEVGVLHGYFSIELMEAGLEDLLGVDIVEDPNISNVIRDFYPRYSFSRSDSISASKQQEDNSFDLVYLDDDHTYKHVKEELRAWWPKIKVGGILAGHDFIEYDHKELGPYGIVQAVREFCVEYNLTCYINTSNSSNFNHMLKIAEEQGAKQKQVEQNLVCQHVEVPNFWILKEKS